MARTFPEKTILVRSRARLHCIRFGTAAQIAALITIFGVSLWTVTATGAMALRLYADAEEEAVHAQIAAAYESRLAEASAARDAAERRAAEASSRAEAAVAALSDRHDAFTRALTAEREASVEAAALRLRSRVLAGERDSLETRLVALETEGGDAARRLADAESERDELALTLQRVAVALDEAAVERDDAQAVAGEIEAALGALEAGVAAERDSQAQLLAQIETAAELTIAPLESMLRTAGVDVDGLLEDIRRETGGAGGPFVPAPETTAAVAAIGADRVLSVMTSLERVNLLRLAAARLPFARPIGAARITSGFGTRRDPINGRRASHEGLDFAGPRGSAILAGASGEVVFAGWMSGYGRTVKIRHDFGFETLYAHLDRIRVRKGERVEAGERVGDLGNTGRSTGPHLHYEIRVGGRSVDPYKFIKASRDVL